jgi:hypothetical protein
MQLILKMSNIAFTASSPTLNLLFAQSLVKWCVLPLPHVHRPDNWMLQQQTPDAIRKDRRSNLWHRHQLGMGGWVQECLQCCFYLFVIWCLTISHWPRWVVSRFPFPQIQLHPQCPPHLSQNGPLPDKVKTVTEQQCLHNKWSHQFSTERPLHQPSFRLPNMATNWVPENERALVV